MKKSAGKEGRIIFFAARLWTLVLLGFGMVAAQGATLHYQARLTDPATGAPREGTFTMTFRLYDVAVDGTALWVETKDVAVGNGLFSTALGDVESLPEELFDGRELWLGIKVGADAEAVPRQPLAYVAYSLFTDNADLLDGKDATEFAEAVHTHDGSEISGVLGETVIPPSFVQIPQVLDVVKEVDGPGSGLNADLLDGLDSPAFVKDTGPEAITSASSKPTLSVTQSGGGIAGEFQSDTNSGLVGSTLADVNYKAGVIGRAGEVALSVVGKYGVYGESDTGKGVAGVSDTDTGIFGYSISADAIKGQTPNGSGAAMRGLNTSGTGTAYGVYGSTSSEEGIAVLGNASDRTGSGVGVKGQSLADSGIGVLGTVESASGATAGVKGESVSSTGTGVLGTTTSVMGMTVGVKGETAASGGIGVHGTSSHTTGTTYGVLGESESEFDGAGVRGNGNYVGVWGEGGRWGLYGTGGADSGNAYGVYASLKMGSTGYAGYFSGNVHVTGSLSKGSGSFKIDHPLDPENKYLSHSFVESPDMMNVYNGTVVLDAEGSARVAMPDWFEALNRDFRYQLTAMGAPGPNLYIAEEIQNNQFRIAGGSPGLKVSWQVTGVRQDPYAEANRIVVEEDKPEAERGTYLHPEAYGLGEEKGVTAVNGPEASK